MSDHEDHDAVDEEDGWSDFDLEEAVIEVEHFEGEIPDMLDNENDDDESEENLFDLIAKSLEGNGYNRFTGKGTKFEYAKVSTEDYPAGKRTYKKLIFANREPKIVVRIISSGTNIVVTSESFTDGKGDHIIGVMSEHSEKKINFEINMQEAIQRAEYYNEELETKGTGSGYSMFVHSIFIAAASRDGTTEPMASSWDVTTPDGSKIEVTSLNYQTRHKKSFADAYVCKYRFLELLGEIGSNLSNLSRKEETNDNTGFCDTAFDTETTIFTKHVDVLSRVVKEMTEEQMKTLSTYTCKLFSELPTAPPIPLDSEKERMTCLREIHRCMTVGGCENLQLYPSPYRVGPNRTAYNSDYLTRIAEDYVETSEFKVKTTFRTETPEMMDSWHDRIQNRSATSMKTSGIHPAYRRAEHLLLKYEAFQTLKVETDLIRNVGRTSNGMWYSSLHNMGIAWWRGVSGTKGCCFYTFDDPGFSPMYGIWKNHGKCWQSPSFNLNASDVSFAAIVYSRFIVMVSSLLQTASVTADEIMYAMCVTRCCWNNSSWFTSSLVSNHRFITTCIWANDPKCFRLIQDQFDVSKPLRSSDYAVLMCYRKYCSRPMARTNVFTNLPFGLLALDKDIALGMQWHTRGKSHANACMGKIVSAMKAEVNGELEIMAKSYETQAAFYTKASVDGCTYEEFRDMENSLPKCPILSIGVYVGLTYLMKDDFDDASRNQSNQNMTIHNLTSARSCAQYDEAKSLWCTSHVAESLTKDMLSMKSKSLHTLVLEQSKQEKKIEQEYVTFHKDHKSSNRGIAEMMTRMRPAHHMRENICRIPSMSADGDLLHERAKYQKIISSFRRILLHKSGPRILSSQDREKHCRFLHPEVMSLCYLINAAVCHIPPMVTASALIRHNKTRKVVFPFEYNDGLSIFTLKHTMVARRQGNETRMVPMAKIHLHMMEGVEHTGAGVINTTYVSGMNKVLKILMPTYIVDSAEGTTADDAGVGHALAKDCDADIVSHVTTKTSQEFLGKTMMKGKEDKDVVSEQFIEMNNIAVSVEGMLPQSVVHGLLAIQPLTGKSPIHDLMACQTSAVSIVSWNESPSLCFFTIEANLKNFQSRWLFKDAEMSLLRDAGLVMTTIRHFVEGPAIRNVETFARIWNSSDEEAKQGMLDTTTSPLKELNSLMSEKTGRAKIPFLKQVGLESFDRKNKLIISAKRQAGFIRTEHIRLPSFSKIAIYKKNLIKFLTDPIEVTHEHEEIYQLWLPIRPNIHYRKPIKKDREPCSMGEIRRCVLPSMRKICAKRNLGITLREELTERERKISELNDEDFEKERLCLSRIDSVFGRSFSCPSGLPLITTTDRGSLLRPATFNFSYSFGSSVKEEPRMVRFSGLEVIDYRPCMWGDTSILRAKHLLKAYGTGYINGELFCFFGRYVGPPRSKVLKHMKARVVNRRACVDGLDVSFIRTERRPYCAEINKAGLDSTNIFCPFLTGRPSVLANYGYYIHSDTRSGHDLFTKYLAHHGIFWPSWNRKHMISYPTFDDDATLYDMASSYVVTGAKCIRKIRLTAAANKVQAIIDISEEDPKVVSLDDLGEEAIGDDGTDEDDGWVD